MHPNPQVYIRSLTTSSHTIIDSLANQGVVFTGIRQPVFPAVVIENVSATQQSKEVVENS